MADTAPNWAVGVEEPAWAKESAPPPQKKSGFGGTFGDVTLNAPRRDLGKDLGAAAYGLTTQLAGAPGDIADVVGLGGALPTTSDIRGQLKNTPLAPAKGEEGAMEVGGAAPLLAAGAGLAREIPAVAKAGVGLVGKGLSKAAETVLGTPSRSVEEIARKFEGRGYKLEPGQLKADQPYHSPGFMGARIANQKLANREASAVTGAPAGTNGIDAKFLNSRFDDLGRQYDKIVEKSPVWTVDGPAITRLREILSTEQAAVPGQVRPVMQVASKFEQAAAEAEKAGTKLSAVRVSAKDLKRSLSELKRIARTSRDGQDRYAATGAIDAITGSLERNHPDVAKGLQDLNQKYRATVALQDLYDSGGIKGGNISLRKLGGLASRLQGNPLHELAEGGRELNLAARWEGAGANGAASPETLLSPGKLARALATGMGGRSQIARGIQRNLGGD